MRPLHLFLIAALLLPVALAAPPERVSACLVGAVGDGRIIQTELVMTWNEARGVYEGTLWIHDLVLPTVIDEVRVIAFDQPLFLAPEDRTARFLHIVDDPEARGEHSVFLLGPYALDRMAASEFVGTIDGEFASLAGTL